MFDLANKDQITFETLGLMFDVRERNTIPKGARLNITFKGNPVFDSYEYKNKNGQKLGYSGGTVMARIEYNKEYSDLIFHQTYPLVLSQNALVGLRNYLLNKKELEFNLDGRNFSVHNRNNHTYVWNEITTIQKEPEDFY